MANDMLLDEEEKKTELNGTADNTLETARETANDAVKTDSVTEGNAEVNVPQDATQNAPQDSTQNTPQKPLYTSDEVVRRLESGNFYTKDEIDAMSEDEYANYERVGQAWYDAHPTKAMKKKRLEDRLDMAERLSKMAGFVADETEGDDEFASDNKSAKYARDFLANSPSTFAKFTDEEAAGIVSDIQRMYYSASKRRGHLDTFVDALKRGHSGLEKMIYQGGSLLLGDGGNTEESRAIQRQTELDDLSNPQKIGSVENVNSFGSGLDFLLESFGENVERIGVGAAASTIGAVAGGVPGAIIAGSLGTMVLNGGEAVGDQLEEMQNDEDMRFSRALAIAQTTGYSIFDGALGVVPGLGKVWSKALKMAGKDVGKKASVEFAKDIAAHEGLKNFGWNFLKSVGGEAIQEPAQSQIVGRGRRYLQTGSPLRKGETEEKAWMEALDEAAGGAAASFFLGGLGGAVETANANRVQKTFDNMFKVLGQEETFKSMDPATRILVSMRVANDALGATKGVLSDEQKASLNDRSKEIDGYIRSLSESGSQAKREIANTARTYLDVLNSQYTTMTTETAEKIANANGIVSEVSKETFGNGEKKSYADGSSADVFTDKTGIQVAHKFSADGTDEGWIVANARNRKMALEPSVFATEDEAVAYAQKLDLLNKVRDGESAKKKSVIESVFRNMYGERAPRLRFVDRPDAATDQGDNALQAGAIANYDPAQNVVRINTDAINNLGQLYTVLGHERFHEDIAEYLLNEAIGPNGITEEQANRLRTEKNELFGGDNVKGAKELYKKNPTEFVTSGKTDEQRIAQFGEEMVTERASVADLVKQLRSTRRGALSELAARVGQRIGLKMANDLGVSPELITRDDVAAEINHLWQNGYTGIHAEIQLPTENAKTADGESINDYLSRQNGGEVAAAKPTENVAPDTESAPVASETVSAEEVKNETETPKETEKPVATSFADEDYLIKENGYTYVSQDKADEYAKLHPEFVRQPVSDNGDVKFEKPKEVAQEKPGTASTASEEVKLDNEPVESAKGTEAVPVAPVESAEKAEDADVRKEPAKDDTEADKTEQNVSEVATKQSENDNVGDQTSEGDDTLLDDLLAGNENYGATEAKKVDDKLPSVKVGDEITRDQIDEGRVNAENIVKDADKRNLGLKNWVVDRISDDGRTVYLKPGKTDAQKKAAEIVNPLRGQNGQLRKSFMGSDLYEKAKSVLQDERHTADSLKKIVADFKEAEKRIFDSGTFAKSGMKAEFDRMLDAAERRIGEIETQNRLNRGQAARERAHLRRGEKTDSELKDMFRWWMKNDQSAESSWLGAFVSESGKFDGIFSVPPGITWSRDVSMTPGAEWSGSNPDVIPASSIFNVTLDKYNNPHFTAKDTKEARFYSRFLFGMSPDDALKYAIGVREGRNTAGSFDGLITERIGSEIGLTDDAARDLEMQYDSSAVVEVLLNEYLDVENSWDAHKRGYETNSERDMRERDEFMRNERERMEREERDEEARRYLEDYAIAEDEFARGDEELARLESEQKAQIDADIENGMFKTAPAFAMMFKTAPKMTREEEKAYVRSLGPKIYDDLNGAGAEAWGELYRLYRMGEGTKGGVDNWLRHLGVPEGKIDLLADHVWKKVEQTRTPSDSHSKIWHKLSPETIIGNAVVNTVKAWRRSGDSLEEKGVSKNIANYDEGVGDDEGEITSKDELISPDTLEDVDQTSLYQSAHYRRNQERALVTLSALKHEMSEDRSSLITAWQKAHYIAFDRLSDERFAKMQEEVDRLAVSARKSPEAAKRYIDAINKLRKVRRDALYNMTSRIAADSLNRPVGIYRYELRELFKEMRTAFGKGGVAYSPNVNDGADFIRVEGVDVQYTADEIIDMMIEDDRIDMAYVVERAEDGMENEAIANAWNKDHRNAIAKLAKTDRKAARKLAKSPADIRALLSKARSDYGWKDQRASTGNKSQTNMGIDVETNATEKDVKDFVLRNVNLGLSDSRIAKKVEREFNMEPMAAANAVSKAKASMKRVKKAGGTVQGDLFGTMTGEVERPKAISYHDQMRAIRNAVNDGKDNDAIVKLADKSWTMDENRIREEADKIREANKDRADKAEAKALEKISIQEAKKAEEAERLAKVKTYKVGDVALIPVNETGDTIPAAWDADDRHRAAYRIVKNAVRIGKPMSEIASGVAEMRGIPKMDVERLYNSLTYGSREKYVGDVRAMVANGVGDDEISKAVVKKYGVSDAVARREIDSAKRKVAADEKADETKRVISERIDMTNRFGNADSIASSEARSKYSEEELAKKDAEYKEEQRQISEDREFRALSDLYDGNRYKILEELKARGRDKKRISGTLRRNASHAEYGEIVKTEEVALPGDFGLTKEQSKSKDRAFVDKVMEGVEGDALKGVQSLRTRGLTQAKAEKMVRDWGRRHLKPVNLSAAKEKANDEKAKQDLFGDLMAFKTAVTPVEDAAYRDAVKRGDMETAQGMVFDAAKKAYGDDLVVDGNGNPVTFYRGDVSKRKVFDPSKDKNGFGDVYFTDVREYAEKFGPEVQACLLVVNNPSVHSFEKEGFSDALTSRFSGNDAAFVHGVVDFTGIRHGEVLMRKMNNIKSADPVTYDDAGNVIPLSERFNPQSDNIMFKTQVSADDLRYVLGARASMEAHGTAVPKDVVRQSKRDADLDAVADLSIRNADYRTKLVERGFNNEAMTDQEARELFLIARDEMAGVVSQRNGMNAINGKVMAETEEKSNAALERVITAMMRAFSNAGATLRQAQRGASLDEMRDLGVYLMSEVKATMAKKGIEGGIPQGVKDLVDRQAKELAAKNEEIDAARQKIVELTEKADKAAADLAIAEMKAKVAEPFRMSADARQRLANKYGFTVTDSSVEAVNALARLAGIAPKDVMSKGEGKAAELTDEVRECFGQIVSDANFDYDKALAFVRGSLGNAYDDAFAAYRKENEAGSLTLTGDDVRESVRTNVEGQRKRFVKRHPKGRAVQMPLGLTLGGLQDRLEQERRNCRAVMDASSDSDERSRSLGRYLRRFVQVRVAEDQSLTNDRILTEVAEEANRMDPDGEFTVQDAARIVSGAKGFDPATKEAIDSRLSVLKKAMGLAREGKLTEAAKLAGASVRTEAQMLEDMEKSLMSELDRLNRSIADILENPMPDEKETADRVNALKEEIAETIETLRKMRDERKADEKKDSVLRILSDRHRKLVDALEYEKSRKDWNKALTPDAERARQMLIPKYEEDIRRLAAELAAVRRDNNLMRSLQRQIDEFQRRIDEKDFEPAPKRVKPRIESYSQQVQEKMRERDNMRKAFRAQRDSYQFKKLSKPVQVWKDTLDILGELKAVVGSMDFSSVFRQGGQLSWAHPLLAKRNMVKMAKVFADERLAQRAMDEIRKRPNAKYYEQAGVDFTDWGVNATNADDRFVLNHFRKFTNMRLLKAGIEMSERAFSMYLNLMRADVFDQLVASSTYGDASKMSVSQLKAIGKFINTASQRGAIDKQSAIGKAIPFLNNVLWSPRNVISRFQFIWETFKLAMPWADPYGDKTLRGMFAKELLRYIGGVAAAITFTKTMADLLRGDDEPPEDLELDPRSTNFLTVKLGNTHVDFLSGLKQVMVFSSRVITQKSKNTRGELSDVRSNTELFGRFLRSKFAPGTGLAYDIATRETFERQDLEWLSLANDKERKGVIWHAAQQVVPLTFTDLYEQWKLSGIPHTVITGIGTILGAGVQAYDPYTYKQLSGDYRYFRKLYLSTTDEEERKRLVEYHPMLNRMGSIEAQIKTVNGLKAEIKKYEKVGMPTDELKDRLEREQKRAINIMAGFKNPMDTE